MLRSHAIARADATPGDLRAGAGAGQQGAVLVHAAVALTGLLAFSALTIDLGTMWVARAQAQNAADAGALAGAVSLAYVDPTDTDTAKAATLAVVQAHRIWGETVAGGHARVTSDTCPTGSPAVAGACINVTVGRGGEYGPAMPTFFARLFGGGPSVVWASASGKVLTGNSTNCLRPLALADAWDDREDSTAPVDGAWTDDDVFDGYDSEGHAAGPTDSYRPPDAGSPGSGITVASMVGRRVVRQLQNPLSGLPLPANALLAFDLSRPGMEGELDQETLNRYEANVETCPDTTMSIGARVQSFDVHDSHYTADPLTRLIASDDAHWDPVLGQVVSAGGGVSPRIITIGVADPLAFSEQRRIPPAGGSAILPTVPLQLRNLIGFFVEEVRTFAGGEVQVTGVIVPVPGRFDQSAPVLSNEAAFLRSVALVR